MADPRIELLLRVAVVQLRELGLRSVGGQMRFDNLIEPGVVLIDGVPNLNDRDAAVFHDGEVGDEPSALR